MRLIDDADERLFHTVTVAARIGRAGRLVETLMADYDEHWDDPEAAFRYALALVAVIQAAGDDRDKRIGYSRSLEALDDVLEGDPGHWLARYCRLRHRVLIRTGYGRYQEYLADDRGAVAADIDELLRAQAAVPWQPYFTAAYLVAAQFHAGQGEPAAAAELVGAAAARPHRRMPYPALGSILSEPFLILYQGAELPAVRPVVGAMMGELYPDNPAIRSVLRAGLAA
jgi:hypothetical protein